MYRPRLLSVNTGVNMLLLIFQPHSHGFATSVDKAFHCHTCKRALKLLKIAALSVGGSCLGLTAVLLYVHNFE